MGQTQAASSKAERYTFGIEIECLVPSEAIRRLGITTGAYHHGHQLPAPFPAGWTAERDGSVGTSSRHLRPVEIVSPVLRGRAGLDQAKQVGQVLRSLGAQVNQTCGFHVHVGAASVAGDDHAAQAEWVGKLLYHTAMHERALYASTGTRRRENGNFCRSINGEKTVADALRKAPKSRKADVLQRASWSGHRYRSLNLTNLFSSKATVEFRWAAGTVEAMKMVGHIQTCLALAQKAMEPAKMDWEAVASERTYHQAGAGARALDRFFYLMGWTKGRRDVGKPTVEMAGWVGDVADLPKVKAELKRLARKYDKAVA